MGLESVPASAASPVPPTDNHLRWNLFLRIAFRFVFVYLVLYILPFPVAQLSGLIATVRGLIKGEEATLEELMNDGPTEPFLEKWVTKPYEKGMEKAVVWTGEQVKSRELLYRPLGSGDTTWNYIQVLLFGVVAATLTLLWTLAAWAWWKRSRREQLAYPYLHEALRVYVRFYLAYFMIVYGTMKVIKLQFGAASPDGLLHTYGESSPMHLLWTFMGASEGYNWFAGGGEMLGGLLLCFRRTTLLGAIVTAGVMTHVAVLNFCFDVPVKLFSMHLVLAALFVMSQDWPWMAKVFLLGRRAMPRGVTPLTRWKWLNWTMLVLRTLVVGTFVGVTLHGAYKQSKVYGDHAPQPPMSGLWEVEEFSLDGAVRPPLTTDAVRWQRAVITKGFRGPMFITTTMTGAKMYYPAIVDEETETIVLTRFGAAPGQPPLATIHYTQVEPGVIVVEGELPGKKAIKAKLRHYGDEQFLLRSRGFRWINETPYNVYGPKDKPPPGIPPPPKKD